MKVLVIGSGGREHALGWKIAQSPLLKALFFAPGNPGTAKLGTNIALAGTQAICDFAREEAIDLVVVGPEQPLVEGLADALAHTGILCYGPSKAAAQLEGSKAFAKDIMRAAGVKTAAYEVFSDFNRAWAYAEQQKHPLVVKADGLAAGKGVSICQTPAETQSALREALQDSRFGDAGSQVVIESFLKGREASFHLICDGERVVPLISAQDHKTLNNGNTGPNTGGMGTFAPTPFLTSAMEKELIEQVCLPVLKELKQRGAEFRGTLFTGLMLTDDGPYVLEFNCRFGDPETQVMMMLLNDDLLPVLKGSAEGKLPCAALKWHKGSAVCVVLAASGYPGTVRKGDAIHGLEVQDSATIFQAGTELTEDQTLVTNGGRVLGITAAGEDLEEAREKAYLALSFVDFKGLQYRSDIGLLEPSQEGGI